MLRLRVQECQGQAEGLRYAYLEYRAFDRVTVDARVSEILKQSVRCLRLKERGLTSEHVLHWQTPHARQHSSLR